MNEGSLRCDVNLSIHKPGQPFGTRTEMKNLNSFQSVQRAIEEEYRRQVEAVERGETIVQETRRFDQQTGKTSAMRRKENANDYRYFPDPDLATIVTGEDTLAAWREELPVLPDQRKARYMADYGLTAYAAEQLVSEKALAEYFEAACESTAAPKTLANLMLTEVFRLLPPESTAIPLAPAHLGRLADMVEQGDISAGVAKPARGRPVGTRSGPRRLGGGRQPAPAQRPGAPAYLRGAGHGGASRPGDGLLQGQGKPGQGPHGRGHGAIRGQGESRPAPAAHGRGTGKGP